MATAPSDIPWSKTILYPQPVDVDTDYLHPVGSADYKRCRKRQRAEFAFRFLNRVLAYKERKMQKPPPPPPPPSPRKEQIFSDKELGALLEDVFQEINVEKEIFPSEEAYIV
jgi:hypothetical protein